MKAVLVTGAAGFIGSELCKSLVSQGAKVVGVDNLSLGHRSNIPPEVEFIELDASELEQLEVNLANVELEHVYHLAGQSGGELSFSESIFDCRSNVLSTLAILEFARSKKVESITHASSVAVYGTGNSDGKYVLDEEASPEPTSPYGISKFASERYLRVLSGRYGITSTSLRFFNVYGAGQDLSRLDQGMLSIYLSQALRGRRVEIKGSSDRYRDFIHVSDVVRYCIDAMGIKLKRGGHININLCTGRKTTVQSALNLLDREFSGQLDMVFSDPTPGDVEGWVGSTSKLESTFGWLPRVGFEDGFSEMIRLEKIRASQVGDKALWWETI